MDKQRWRERAYHNMAIWSKQTDDLYIKVAVYGSLTNWYANQTY